MVRVTFVVILKMVGVDLECVGLWGSGGGKYYLLH
jgi:hypothetical protein